MYQLPATDSISKAQKKKMNMKCKTLKHLLDEYTASCTCTWCKKKKNIHYAFLSLNQ